MRLRRVSAAARRMCVAACAAHDVSTTTLCVVDAHNLAFRYFYGIKPLDAPDGTPVHVVLAACNRMLRMQQEYPNARLILAFDEGQSEYRNTIQPNYKDGRPKAPPSFYSQISIMKTAANCLGVPTISIPGIEADDIIARIVQQATEDGIQKVVISSTDKDLLQLVTGADARTTVVTMFNERKKVELYESDVFEQHGVYPQQMADMLALAGDSSDNVVGVPGIGPKTAAKLLSEHGDVEGILQAAETQEKTIKPKMREKLLEHSNLIRKNMKLVDLTSGWVEVDIAANELRGESIPDPSSLEHKLRPFLRAYGFKQLERRLYPNKR